MLYDLRHEYQIEELLEVEVRPLPMPDGTTRNHPCFKITWDAVDTLLKKHDYALEMIAELAVAECKESGYPFWWVFPDVVAYIHNKFEEAFPYG